MSYGQVFPGNLSGGVRIEVGSDCTTVWLSGEHDLSTAPVVGAALISAAVSGLDVVVDVQDVAFMDVSTLSCMIQGRNLLAASQRRLGVRNPTSGVRRLLEVTGADDLIEVDGPGRPPTVSALETWVEVPPSAPPTPDRSPVGSYPTSARPASDDHQRSVR